MTISRSKVIVISYYYPRGPLLLIFISWEGTAYAAEQTQLQFTFLTFLTLFFLALILLPFVRELVPFAESAFLELVLLKLLPLLLI